VAENVYLCKNITNMKWLQLYDYEKVKREYQYSLEVITPPNNDGSRPRYSFPIKHQVLRCGKWIPTEDMYYRAVLLYYYLQQEEALKAYEGKGLQWHDNIKGEQ
jgi:hypothetical protein